MEHSCLKNLTQDKIHKPNETGVHLVHFLIIFSLCWSTMHYFYISSQRFACTVYVQCVHASLNIVMMQIPLQLTSSVLCHSFPFSLKTPLMKKQWHYLNMTDYNMERCWGIWSEVAFYLSPKKWPLLH